MSWVYFIKPTGLLGPVKIGVSLNPADRLLGLMAASPLELEIVCKFPGGFAEEALLHRMFAADRLHGEWFRPSPRMTAVIAAVQAETFSFDRDERNHSDIVRAAGAPETVAKDRGVSVHTVRSWIQRNSIPAEHWAAFADDGKATLEELAYAAARPAPEQAHAA